MKMWMFISMLIMVISLYHPGQAQEGLCEAPIDVVVALIEETIAEVVAVEGYTPVDDDIWASFNIEVNAVIESYLTTCADPMMDRLRYDEEHPVRAEDDLFGYSLKSTISFLDVNLDSSDDLLVKVQVGRLQYGAVRTFATVYYKNKDDWEHEVIWPPPLDDVDEDTLRQLEYNRKSVV